jgi:hypothetical protein
LPGSFGRIDWFRLREMSGQPEEGGIESEAFPGLVLHVEKMLAGDVAGVIDLMEARRMAEADDEAHA